jgi:translation initiation factor 3 subunit C
VPARTTTASVSIYPVIDLLFIFLFPTNRKELPSNSPETNNMSRFWAAEGFSSDSDDSSDDSSRSSDDVAPQGGGGYKGRGGIGGTTSQWADLSDSEDEENEVRFAKSAKDRASEQLQNHIASIRNAFKVNDWSKMQSEFDAVARLVSEKSRTLWANGVPRFFVRLLCDLEDKVRQGLADKASFKKLSATNGRALNRLKLTLRKHNKAYEEMMEQYRANPVLSSSSESESDQKRLSDSESDSESSSTSSSSSNSSDSDSDDEIIPKTVSAKKRNSLKLYGTRFTMIAVLSIIEWIRFLVSDTSEVHILK